MKDTSQTDVAEIIQELPQYTPDPGLPGATIHGHQTNDFTFSVVIGRYIHDSAVTAFKTESTD